MATEGRSAAVHRCHPHPSGMTKRGSQVDLLAASTTHLEPASGIVSLLEQDPGAIEERLRRGDDVPAVHIGGIAPRTIDLRYSHVDRVEHQRATAWRSRSAARRTI